MLNYKINNHKHITVPACFVSVPRAPSIHPKSQFPSALENLGGFQLSEIKTQTISTQLSQKPTPRHSSDLVSVSLKRQRINNRLIERMSFLQFDGEMSRRTVVCVNMSHTFGRKEAIYKGSSRMSLSGSKSSRSKIPTGNWRHTLYYI